MVTRAKISDAVLNLLLAVQGHHLDRVQLHSTQLIKDLELLSSPANAEPQGLSSVNVHYVRTLISEALELSNSHEWRATENAVQQAIQRWNEER